MKIILLILSFSLMLSLAQKTLQAGQSFSKVAVEEHSHGHVFSFTDLLSLLWTGNMEHDHSHDESSDESTHGHSHRHQVASSISFLEFTSSVFHLSFSQFEPSWSGVLSRAPQDPFLFEILRPPIS